MKSITDIHKAIASITSSGAKLDKLIQDTAVSVAEHFAEHKDTGLVNRLFLAMPKGSRRMALADWLLKFVAVAPNTDAKSKAEQPFVYAKDKGTNALEGAKVQWYELKKEKAVDEVFDVRVKVMALLRHIEKSAKLEHYDANAEEAMTALAVAVGIPASDVPKKAATMQQIADAEPAPM